LGIKDRDPNSAILEGLDLVLGEDEGIPKVSVWLLKKIVDRRQINISLLSAASSGWGLSPVHWGCESMSVEVEAGASCGKTLAT